MWLCGVGVWLCCRCVRRTREGEEKAAGGGHSRLPKAARTDCSTAYERLERNRSVLVSAICAAGSEKAESIPPEDEAIKAARVNLAIIGLSLRDELDARTGGTKFVLFFVLLSFQHPPPPSHPHPGRDLVKIGDTSDITSITDMDTISSNNSSSIGTDNDRRAQC